MDAEEEQVHADVATYGLHVIHVMEDAKGPPFSYSVGLNRSAGHAEILVVGLPQDVAHSVVNDFGKAVRAGKKYDAGRVYDDFLEGYSCTFRVVPKKQYRNYLGWDVWFYGGEDFAALQLVYPDRDGRWPWQDGVSNGFRSRQPILVDEDDPTWAPPRAT